MALRSSSSSRTPSNRSDKQRHHAIKPKQPRRSLGQHERHEQKPAQPTTVPEQNDSPNRSE